MTVETQVGIIVWVLNVVALLVNLFMAERNVKHARANLERYDELEIKAMNLDAMRRALPPIGLPTKESNG